MTPQSFGISPQDIPQWKAHILAWASQFPYAMVLDNCEHSIDRYGKYELLVGVNEKPENVLQTWADALEKGNDTWLMGGMPYELKNRFEPKLSSQNPPTISFPEIALFVPETIVYVLRDEWGKIHIEGKKADWEAIFQQHQLPRHPIPAADFQSNFSRDDYLTTVKRLQAHIKDGDCYEINLSQVFEANYQMDAPAQLFAKLISVSPVPFAAFFRFDDRYLICASPERFLQHQNGRLLSQPIKGTSKRGKTPEEDAAAYDYLQHSIKERAENVMIVDLTRNDLYRCSKVNSVSVPYLFEIQAFPQVFQMVSSVVGEKEDDLSWQEVFARIFPPGSMTGAPKVRTMQLIEAYERHARGLYAGSVGYVEPNGNFDWNVVIRSLVYDAQAERLLYQVGGAITYDSEPQAEYEETIVKAEGIRLVFGGEDEGDKDVVIAREG